MFFKHCIAQWPSATVMHC